MKKKNLYTEIESWLKLSADERDFAHGLDMFRSGSRHIAMTNYLTRKQDMQKLEWELEKLLKTAYLKLKETPTVAEGVQQMGDRIKKLQEPAKQPVEITQVSETNKTESKRVLREDLSAELQVIYDQTIDAIKEQRTVHEKMKLVPESDDEARKELRERLEVLDNQIAAGWETIDARNNPPEPEKPETPVDATKAINSARAYISRNAKTTKALKGDKKKQRVEELKNRVEVLIQHNAAVNQATYDLLKSLGVIGPDTGLTVQ